MGAVCMRLLSKFHTHIGQTNNYNLDIYHEIYMFKI